MFPYGTNVFKVCENEMLTKMIKNSVEEKDEMNISIIESNRTDNDLLAKYSDDDLDFDLDDELKELTERHLHTDTEDEMITHSPEEKEDIKKKDNKADTKKKDNKADTQKKDNKPDTKKKDNKPDIRKKDNKPDTKKKDTKKKNNKPDSKKKDNKPDTKKKDNKPDTSKNIIENRASNSIKYKIQDIAKYRKVFIKMIKERMYILDLMNMWLAESIDNTDIVENMCTFARLCHASQIKIIFGCHQLIYAVNVALECLRDDVGNGIWPKSISYDNITLVNGKYVNDYYQCAVYEKRLIKTTCEEIEMVRRLIETNIHKYENIVKGVGEMDIYSLDQACADIDRTIGYIQKIIIMIPSIVEKIDEFRRKRLRRRIAIQNFLNKEYY